MCGWILLDLKFKSNNWILERGVTRRKGIRSDQPDYVITPRVRGKWVVVLCGCLEMCPSLVVLETCGHTGEKKWHVFGQNKLPSWILNTLRLKRPWFWTHLIFCNRGRELSTSHFTPHAHTRAYTQEWAVMELWNVQERSIVLLHAQHRPLRGVCSRGWLPFPIFRVRGGTTCRGRFCFSPRSHRVCS